MEPDDPTHSFVDRFYEIFIAGSPEVAARFKDVDMARQRRHLELSLIYMSNPTLLFRSDTHMVELARAHGQRETPPELYAVWVDALRDTVRELDPQGDDEVLEAWRRGMQRGIDFMIKFGGEEA